MPTDHIRYDILAQQALRGLVRHVLSDAAANGLPGEHHFYITFDTTASGVKISKRMLAQYPNEMTVVLQHQFWDMLVDDSHFEVGLSFGGIPEKLAVPFEAITSFADPSVQFALQFETLEEDADAPDETKVTSTARSPVALKEVGGKDAAKGVSVVKPVKTGKLIATPAAAKSDSAKQKATEAKEAKPDTIEPPPSGGADVVRLDRFRKK